MSKSKSILPNVNGLFHGYCERYWSTTGGLMWGGVMVNGHEYGYFESYYKGGGVNETDAGYFLGGDKVSVDNTEGYCYIWNRK